MTGQAARREGVSPAEAVTVVRGGSLVAFAEGTHRVLPAGELTFSGERILYAGPRYDGHADHVVDASGCLVFPGLISTHAHVGCHAGDRMVLDHGRPDFPRTGFLNYAPPLLGGAATMGAHEDLYAASRYGLACLLQGGVTTVVEMGGGQRDHGQSLLRAMDESGIRMYYGPAVQGGHYAFDREGRLHRDLDEAAGMAALDRAERFVGEHDGECSGRLRGMLVLDEFFNSTPALLKALRAAADRLRVGVTMHFAEQVYEFHRCVADTGRTPVQLLQDCGLLGPDVVLGHCLYVTGHPFADRNGDGDLRLLAAAGASVAHSPVAVARRGAALHSLARYKALGVRVALGTDSYPLDGLAEMRWAALLGRMVSRDAQAVSTQDAFDAATVAGADALRRPDLGRLEAGACADFVLMRIDDPRFGAVHDAIDALVFSSSAELIDRVYVAGRCVVERGHVKAWPAVEVLGDAQATSRRVWADFSRVHWAARAPLDLYPPAFPIEGA